MKIAVVTPGILPVPSVNGGAVEVLTDYIIDGFLEHQDLVDVYTIKDKKLEQINKKGLRIIQISFHQIEFFICRCINYIFKQLKINIVIFPYDLKLRKQIKKNKYDYIIVENNLLLYRNVYQKYTKKYKDTKFIMHIHNTLSDKRTEEAYKFIADTADKIIFVSNFVKNNALKVKKSTNVEVLYNGIDKNLYKKKAYKDIRKKYNIQKENIVYIFTGRVTKEKGILELVKAFNLLNKEYKNVNLLIVGTKNFNCDQKDDYFKQLEEEGKNSNIIFTGYVDKNQIPDYLYGSDVAILPSTCEEAFPLCVLEALASKKATIVSNSGGIMEEVDNQCAIIVNKKENLVQQLYEAMKQLYENKELRKQLGKEGYKRISNNSAFDKNQYFKNFLKIAQIERDAKDENK